MEIKMSNNLRKTFGENTIENNKNIDLNAIKNSEELISRLMINNSVTANEKRDKENIRRYLELRKMGFSTMHYFTPRLNDDMDYTKTLKIEGGAIISGHDRKFTSEELKNRGKYDYRITMRGSDKIITAEAVAFEQALVSEANRRHLNLKMKDPWAHDAVILYFYKEELLEVVKMLEDFKNNPKYGVLVNNATRHFEPVISYGATVSENSYYGISMAHSEPRYGNKEIPLMGSYGNPGNTFGNYIETECLNKTYNELLKKYNGDVNRITVDEMYLGLITKHRQYMFGEDGSAYNIPLWMNRRNYNEAIKKIGMNKESFVSEKDEQIGVNYFMRGSDLDLESNEKSGADYFMRGSDLDLGSNEKSGADYFMRGTNFESSKRHR